MRPTTTSRWTASHTALALITACAGPGETLDSSLTHAEEQQADGPDEAEDPPCPGAEGYSDGICIYDSDDDSADKATALLPSEHKTGVIGPDLDEDWYAIEVSEAGWWRLDTYAGRDPEFDCTQVMYTPAGELYVSLMEFTGDLWLDSPGRWLLRVADRGGGGDEDFVYSLALSPFTGLYTVEPETADEPSLTLPITTDTQAAVAVLWEEDDPEDTLRFDVAEGVSYLTVSLDGTYVTQNDAISLRLVDPSGVTVSAGTFESFPWLTFPFMRPGAYHLLVEPVEDGDAATVLRVYGSAATTAQEVEPNDSLSASLEGSFLGILDSATDIDGGQAHSDESYLVVQCGGKGFGSSIEVLTVELLSPDGEVVATGPWGAGVTGLPDAAVRLTSDSWGPAAWYNCTLRTEPPPLDTSSGDGD